MEQLLEANSPSDGIIGLLGSAVHWTRLLESLFASKVPESAVFSNDNFLTELVNLLDKLLVKLLDDICDMLGLDEIWTGAPLPLAQLEGRLVMGIKDEAMYSNLAHALFR